MSRRYDLGVEHLSRTAADDGHILISGTGRAGTTLLVQYFTALGFDTGHTLETSRSQVNSISNAGLEHTLSGQFGKRLPYVAKAPRFAKTLGPALAAGRLGVRACVVPMRDLYSAAESRRTVAREAERRGMGPADAPGSLGSAGRRNPAGLEKHLAVQFYNLLHTLVQHEIPVYFLRFPDFAVGEQDPFVALEPLLVAHGVTADESAAALSLVSRPELVHSFDAE